MPNHSRTFWSRLGSSRPHRSSSESLTQLGRAQKDGQWQTSMDTADHRLVNQHQADAHSDSQLSFSKSLKNSETNRLTSCENHRRPADHSSNENDSETVRILHPESLIPSSSDSTSMTQVAPTTEQIPELDSISEIESLSDESSGNSEQVELAIDDMIHELGHELVNIDSETSIDIEELGAELQSMMTPQLFDVENDENNRELASLSPLFDHTPIEHEQAPQTPILQHTNLSEQFDHIISHFAGNNRDRDDIAALPIAAALMKAAGLQEKSIFFYNNNLGQASVPDFVRGMQASAAFAETLGIQTCDYEAGLDDGIQKLVDLFNSGEKVLMLEGGHMEVTYRALEQTHSSHWSNITLLSHSKFNESYSAGGTRNWSNLKRGFPGVRFLEIRDQSIRFRSDQWDWLDTSHNLILRQARALMQSAKQASNAPCNAGMHFYVLTGDDRATPVDVQAFFQEHPLFPESESLTESSTTRSLNSDAPMHALHLVTHPIGTYVAG